ncbi:hypothetical protein OGM63_15305 [Plectonema radiosum NIES-515]|uniref:Uncharacterized protein n=1 Tax=Plectonema radiosum NIES-515 TaxID=2986073 RepID=A0ABT3B0F2_9CYAN|nr:hypothetical protein [Plectonema radiosum]MCV3214868.1 hypothetical protein [Plectonema radiosum NIES-515]
MKFIFLEVSAIARSLPMPQQSSAFLSRIGDLREGFSSETLLAYTDHRINYGALTLQSNNCQQ